MDFLKVEDNYFPRNGMLNMNGNLSTLTSPIVQAIVNCTPDSFYANSRVETEKSIRLRIDEAISQGANWIDIGGYSTRPGAIDISEEEEFKRILPAIIYVREYYPKMVISIDTFRATVAKKALLQGAHIINDVSGGTLDETMFETVGKFNCPYILMHMRGNPQTMQSQTEYSNLFAEVYSFFSEQIAKARAAGIKDILLDPGFGFAKNAQQSFQLLHKLKQLQLFQLPILVGVSRKSMIYKTLDISANEALNGTTALHAVSLLNGASVLRVHDVKEAVETVKLLETLKK